MANAAAGGTVAIMSPREPGAPREAQRRLGYVDGLRALAALYVVASHCMLEIWFNRHPGRLAGWLAWPLSFGHQAVSVFIVLSGFSLMLPVARKGNHLPRGVWGFYLARVRRILPPYYLATTFSLLLIWLFISQKTGTSVHTMPSHLSLPMCCA